MEPEEAVLARVRDLTGVPQRGKKVRGLWNGRLIDGEIQFGPFTSDSAVNNIRSKRVLHKPSLKIVRMDIKRVQFGKNNKDPRFIVAWHPAPGDGPADFMYEAVTLPDPTVSVVDKADPKALFGFFTKYMGALGLRSPQFDKLCDEFRHA